jgi:hypothetical protein
MKIRQIAPRKRDEKSRPRLTERKVIGVGDRFTRLTFTGERRRRRSPSGCSRTELALKCDCGAAVFATSADLHHGKVKSCGCLRSDRRKAMAAGKLSRTATYNSWSMMKDRCLNKNNQNWDRYGGRGVKIADRWMNYRNFLADMGERPKGMTIERVNNDGHYEPGNCRWATRLDQGRNRSTCRRITYNGRTLSLTEWAEAIGVNPRTLKSRLRIGWSVERAFAAPVSDTIGKYDRSHILSGRGR